MNLNDKLNLENSSSADVLRHDILTQASSTSISHCGTVTFLGFVESNYPEPLAWATCIIPRRMSQQHCNAMVGPGSGPAVTASQTDASEPESACYFPSSHIQQ